MILVVPPPTPTPTPTPVPPLGKPSNLSATASSTRGHVSLHWTPSDNATKHWVVGYKGTQRVVYKEASSNSSSSISGLESGVTYSFAVSAGRGNNEWSNWTRYVSVTAN